MSGAAEFERIAAATAQIPAGPITARSAVTVCQCNRPLLTGGVGCPDCGWFRCSLCAGVGCLWCTYSGVMR